MSNETREVFRGHIEECLDHLHRKLLAQWPKRTPGAEQARKPIAEFCGVSVGTVSRWLSTKKLPRGEQYIKMMCYLEMVGYAVIEWTRLPQRLRNFNELIGFGLMSADQAAELLGYATLSTLFQVIHGRHRPNKQKERKMWDAWKERKEELEKKKQEASQYYRLGPPAKAHPARVETPKAEPVRARAPVSRHLAVISIMEGLLTLLDEETIDELNETEMDILQHGASTVHRLSATLVALSSRLSTSGQHKEGE